MRIKIIALLYLLFFIVSASCSEIVIDVSVQEGLGILDEEGLHEVLPTSQFEKDGYFKTHQYSCLIWIPLRPVPQKGGMYYYPSNEERQGMLYAECAYQDKRVGYDLSLYTFLSALNNPYSLLYTENANEAFSKSDYGIAYHGDGNSGAYMGVACNSFVYMVLGSIIPYSSYETATLAVNKGIVSYVTEQSSQGVRLLDILQTPGHVRVISRLWENYRKEIRRIEVSEADDNGVHNIKYTAEEFDEWLSNSDYAVYRFNCNYYKGDISPLPSLDLGISSFNSVPFNNEICTYAGDYASFGDNDYIEINYQKGAYNKMEVYRDDVLIDSIALNDDPSVHTVSIDNRGYGYGTYKARLIGSGCSSAFTYWEVLGAELQMMDNHVYYKCYNGTPVYWGWYNQAGWACWKEEVTGGGVNKSGYIETLHRNVSYPQFKLYIQGKYGRITVKNFV